MGSRPAPGTRYSPLSYTQEPRKLLAGVLTHMQIRRREVPNRTDKNSNDFKRAVCSEYSMDSIVHCWRRVCNPLEKMHGAQYSTRLLGIIVGTPRFRVVGVICRSSRLIAYQLEYLLKHDEHKTFRVSSSQYCDICARLVERAMSIVMCMSIFLLQPTLNLFQDYTDTMTVVFFWELRASLYIRTSFVSKTRKQVLTNRETAHAVKLVQVTRLCIPIQRFLHWPGRM